MKASELIKELEKQIKEYGDRNVVILDDHYANVVGVKCVGDFFVDGDSFKLIFDRIV